MGKIRPTRINKHGGIMEWADGKVIKASITSRVGNECRIKAEGLVGLDTAFEKDGDYIVFKTEAGKTYELSFN